MANQNQGALMKQMEELLAHAGNTRGGSAADTLTKALLSGRDTLPLQASKSMQMGRAAQKFLLPLLQQGFQSWKDRYDARGQFKANSDEIVEALKNNKPLTPYQREIYGQIEKYYPERLKDLPKPAEQGDGILGAARKQMAEDWRSGNPQPLLGQVQGETSPDATAQNPGLTAALAQYMPQLPKLLGEAGGTAGGFTTPAIGDLANELTENDRLKNLLGNLFKGAY